MNLKFNRRKSIIKMQRAYHIILIDPPWAFKTYSKKGLDRSAEKYYPCLDIDELKKLPMDNICKEDCIMFMWTTATMMPEALRILDEWGFEYKTVAFTWIKTNKKADSYFFGMGYWTRQNAEFCLLATKGKPSRVSKGVSQVIDEPETLIHKIGGHSEKPACVRDRIVDLCGNLPRVEIFARQRAIGWDCMGNEIDGKDIREVLGGFKNA